MTITGIKDHVRQSAAGQCAITAALVIALHEAGVLPKDRYTDILERLWIDMPEKDALGEAGAVIEWMLDFLDGDVCSNSASGKVEHDIPASDVPRDPVNGDIAA